MNYNVRMMFTAQPISIDELLKAKTLVEKACVEAFGKENVHCTRIFSSEEYGNIGLYLYINVPKGHQTQLTETKDDASTR